MKKKHERKSEKFRFIELGKDNVISIYELLEHHYKVAVIKEPEKYNKFSFSIDKYEIEAKEDIEGYSEKFEGRLAIELRTVDGVNLDLCAVSFYQLILSWNDENIISSGLAAKLKETIISKERKLLSHAFSGLGEFALTLLLFIAITFNMVESFDLNEFWKDMPFLLLTAGFSSILSSTLSHIIQRKYGFGISFKKVKESIFITHQAELKVGLVTAFATVLLTLVIQNYFF